MLQTHNNTKNSIVIVESYGNSSFGYCPDCWHYSLCSW